MLGPSIFKINSLILITEVKLRYLILHSRGSKPTIQLILLPIRQISQKVFRVRDNFKLTGLVLISSLCALAQNLSLVRSVQWCQLQTIGKSISTGICAHSVIEKVTHA